MPSGEPQNHLGGFKNQVDLITRYESLAVLLVMDDCQHCDTIKAQWDQVETGWMTYKLVVNCSKYREVCDFYSVGSLPRVVRQKDGLYHVKPAYGGNQKADI